MLMSAPMVRATLAGTKTQTRRPLYVATKNCASACEDRRYPADYGKGEFPNLPPGSAWTLSGLRHAKPGDRLWVRESGWERPERTVKMLREGADSWAPYYYDADGISEQEAANFKAWGFKRRPSIHMPRWASRITLEIVDVRVERLQDITEADAIAEGIGKAYIDTVGRQRWKVYPHDDGTPSDDVVRYCGPSHTSDPIKSFSSLWLSINGPGSWAINPWVWVVSFKPVTP